MGSIVRWNMAARAYDGVENEFVLASKKLLGAELIRQGSMTNDYYVERDLVFLLEGNEVIFPVHFAWADDSDEQFNEEACIAYEIGTKVKSVELSNSREGVLYCCLSMDNGQEAETPLFFIEEDDAVGLISTRLSELLGLAPFSVHKENVDQFTKAKTTLKMAALSFLLYQLLCMINKEISFHDETMADELDYFLVLYEGKEVGPQEKALCMALVKEELEEGVLMEQNTPDEMKAKIKGFFTKLGYDKPEELLFYQDLEKTLDLFLSSKNGIGIPKQE